METKETEKKEVTKLTELQKLNLWYTERKKECDLTLGCSYSTNFKVDSKEQFDTVFDDYALTCREYILSKRKRDVFLYRTEEVMKIINDSYDKIEEFEKNIKDKTSKDVAKMYTDRELSEINQLRNSVIPNLMYELEQIAVSIEANNRTRILALSNSVTQAHALVNYVNDTKVKESVDFSEYEKV